MSPTKMVYSFGGGKADGNGSMKDELGGKGANLAEMSVLGIPVPAGFTITTDVCTHYYANGRRWPEGLKAQVEKAIKTMERTMAKKFGDPKNPLLVSVRSGARVSMPGMMETVLNIGLCPATIPGLIARTNERFVYDAYRRLITMYSDVVMEKAAGVETEDGHGIRHQLEAILDAKKAEVGAKADTDLSAADLKDICAKYEVAVKKVLGKPFPHDPMEQLIGGVNAVFQSWMGKRAVSYRRIEKLPDAMGTAVNVQAMVFGNMGETSSTGVAFTRDPSTGENIFYGEYLVNAQGEDVVAGIRTPSPVLKKKEEKGQLSLERQDPKCFKQLMDIRARLEKHFKGMLDIEFTIEDKVLYMLQCRIGKCTGTAAVRMAVEMLKEGLINEREALLRVKPLQLNELLLPSVNPASEVKAEKEGRKLGKGLPAGPGGATGQVVFTAEAAAEWAKKGIKVILVRNETSPEDVEGMNAAEAILTAKGGMTSHAALVARGWGKCCIVGCGELNIDAKAKKFSVAGRTVKEGDFVTLNGTKGVIYEGKLTLDLPNPEKDKNYQTLMALADKTRTINVRANADSGKDAKAARDRGAEGIGLCRTEHMFFDEKRIKAVREMIVASNETERRKAIMKLLPFQRADFEDLFTAMNGLPVTIRLLDPPLHEFLPHEKAQVVELAKELGVSTQELQSRISALHELNPMLGHRGCRLGITYPEITEMQARAIFEAAANVAKKRVKVFPEVMVPLVGSHPELANQKAIIERVAAEVAKEKKTKVDYMIGTMIELPRAALTADKIAAHAEFFSFGTNDLTQTTFGFSRDDIGGFLPDYLTNKILPGDPFESLDQEGVGELVRIGIEKGRSVRPGIKVGICGEHGGDPDSVVFCHRVGMNYVSCSTFRVPIARLAAAQAALLHPTGAAPATKAKAGKAVKGAKKAAKTVVKKAVKAAAPAKKAVEKKAKAVVKAVKKAAAPKAGKGKK